MKALSRTLAVAALAGLAGCGNQTTPGGPGATTRPGATTAASVLPNVGTPDNTFRLDLPTLETDIKQGESKAVTIGITRGTNFDQDVKLDFGTPPKGVTLKPADPTIKASEKNAQVIIEAAKDAALGEHKITVTGTPAKSGAKTSGTMQIQIEKPG